MAREYLIDAYNLMFAHPKIGPLARRDIERARDEFLAIVSQHRPSDAARIVVVFDAHRHPAPGTAAGPRNRSSARSLHVVYATETADAWIQEKIRNHPHPEELTVVTSDGEILATAKAYRCQMLRAGEFLHLPRRRRFRPAPGTDTSPYISKKELAEWEQLFEHRSDDEDKP